jgi:hypothetical protein
MLLIIHAAATLFMVGLIWFVQVVHYPLHAVVGERDFGVYQRAHVARTGWLVGLPMIVEAMTAFALAVWPRPGLPGWLGLIGAGLVVVIWVSTGLVQVPIHDALERRREPAQLRALVRGNWLRTLAWSLRGAVALGMIGLSLEEGL